MYRAVTWAALQRLGSIDDEAAVSDLAGRIIIDAQPPSVKDGRKYDVLVDGEDVTWDIRRPEVDANVSKVSAYPVVRKHMTAQQRRIGERGSVVMVGRDIGTVVFPEAQLKIFLDASVEERARRRYEEIKQRGEYTDYEEILKSMQLRDEVDSTRSIAPLRAADDAFILNTTGLPPEKVLEIILDLIGGKDRV